MKPSIPSPAWQQRALRFIEQSRHHLLHPETGAAARAFLRDTFGLTPADLEHYQFGYNPQEQHDLPLNWGFHPLPIRFRWEQASHAVPSSAYEAAGSTRDGNRSRRLPLKWRVWLPRGILLPIFSGGNPLAVIILHPSPGTLLNEYLPRPVNQLRRKKLPLRSRGGSAVLSPGDRVISSAEPDPTAASAPLAGYFLLHGSSPVCEDGDLRGWLQAYLKR